LMVWSNDTFWLTQTGACGSCSNRDDLLVYASTIDLTRDVRVCAFGYLFSQSFAESCLRRIGFSSSCARVWLNNIRQTTSSCFRICLMNWFTPLTETNPCILCDEKSSGKMFLLSAGRTRRNSGLVSEIDRTESVSRTDIQKIIQYKAKNPF
jgi:hypothetical protein